MKRNKKVEGALPCTVPGCKVTFSHIQTLKRHLDTQHNIKMLTKQIREELQNMADNKSSEGTVQTTPEEAKSIVMAPEEKVQIQTPVIDPELGQKVDTLLQRIPENFCEQFPNLCALGSKVTNLEGSIEQIKKVIPTNISVKIPKMPEPVEFPKIDLDELKAQLSAEFSKLLGETSVADKKALQDALDVKFQQLAEQLTPKSQTKEIEPEPKEIQPIPKPSDLPTEVKTDQHKTFEEIYDCPDCRTKMLNKLAEKISKGEDTSVELTGFVNTVLKKEGQIEDGTKDEKQGKPGSSTRPDISTGTENRGTDGADTKLDGRSAQPSSDEPRSGRSELSSDDTECTGPFCLFTHRRPSQQQ